MAVENCDKCNLLFIINYGIICIVHYINNVNNNVKGCIFMIDLSKRNVAPRKLMSANFKVSECPKIDLVKHSKKENPVKHKKG